MILSSLYTLSVSCVVIDMIQIMPISFTASVAQPPVCISNLAKSQLRVTFRFAVFTNVTGFTDIKHKKLYHIRFTKESVPNALLCDSKIKFIQPSPCHMFHQASMIQTYVFSKFENGIVSGFHFAVSFQSAEGSCCKNILQFTLFLTLDLDLTMYINKTIQSHSPGPQQISSFHHAHS